jgi:HlyD family secretion protein
MFNTYGYSNTIVKISVAIAVLMLASACNKGDGKGVERQSFNVPVITVVQTTAPGYTEVTGTVTGTTAVPVATKLFSAITYMGFEEGDRVSKGDVLVRIDDSDIQAMRNEAAAYRAEAAAALAEVETVVAQGEAGLAQAEAAKAQAEAARADAQADFERAERLAAEDTIPRVHRDKAELGLKIAEENVARAAGAVAQAEAMIAQAEAKRPQVAAKDQQAAAKDQQAASYQKYATLTAPFDGVITRKMAEAGQMANPGFPLYMIEDDSAYRVELGVAESLVGFISRGEQVDVVLVAADGSESQTRGTVDVIGAAANPGTHVVRVELTLEPVEGLFSGRFVRARIPSGERSQLWVPSTAVYYEGDQAFVWRVSPAGVLSRAPIEAGVAQAEQLPVIRGLSDGDRVVAAPQPGLYAGALVSGAAGE